MAWALTVSAACVGACGGKSKQSDGSITTPTPQPAAAKACFALASELPHMTLAEAAANKLGVRIPDATPLASEPDGFVRAQQLVEALELELRDAKSIVSRGLLHDFIFNQLLNRPEAGLERGRAPLPPGLSDSVATAMDSELDRVLNHWMIGGQATLAALLTDDTVFANRELADHYGIAHPPGDEWQPLHQPTAERAGILTGGAFLTRFPAPMARATHLAEALTCATVPLPPGFIASVWDDPARPSTKDIVETTYGQDVPCAQCHRYYVGFGIALDKYDELGRYRETFAGQPIDTSYFLSTPDVAAAPPDSATELEFKNPQELGLGLSLAPGVRTCMVQKLNEFLGGRELTESELACVLGELELNDRQASLWSLMAVLAPEYLTAAP